MYVYPLIYQTVGCTVLCMFAADVGERRRHDLPESCPSYRRDVRSSVSVHLYPVQRRLLADLLVSRQHAALGALLGASVGNKTKMLRPRPRPLASCNSKTVDTKTNFIACLIINSN